MAHTYDLLELGGGHMPRRVVGDESVFGKLFGDSVAARVLTFLIVHQDYDYTLTEIAKNSNVGWKSLYRVWPTLEQFELVVQTRQIGKAKLYRANTTNPAVQLLEKLGIELGLTLLRKAEIPEEIEIKH